MERSLLSPALHTGRGLVRIALVKNLRLSMDRTRMTLSPLLEETPLALMQAGWAYLGSFGRRNPWLIIYLLAN